MNATEFKIRYRTANLSERSLAQQHFLDLCEVLGHRRPAEADPTGESFTFEKAVQKTAGGKGFADVWKKGFFGWEYKGAGGDLKKAYQQLLQYREALDNPPLLVVCDTQRIVIHTNFTNTPHTEYEMLLEEIDTPQNMERLRALFSDPTRLRPGVTRTAITEAAAAKLAQIAQSMRSRGLEAHAVAHFLDRIIFCLFAEDIELLPANLFSRIVANTRGDTVRFSRQIQTLFEAMAHGGDFGADAIRYFNGNLFNDSAVLDLTVPEIEAVRQAADLDWGAVDPSILGTLFERGLDPKNRTQLGAHYTSREDIETIIEPVVLTPLRREWDEVRQSVETMLKRDTVAARRQADQRLQQFVARLGQVTVLDPACGSANFLYVTLQKLKDLEKQVIDYALSQNFTAFLPEVGPWQLYGLELNPYAADLAQMTVWIGYLQWLRDHGYLVADNPVLRSTDNIRCQDAVIDLSDPAHPQEPEWPKVDFIVGNPPFLGDKVMRGSLGDDYVAALRKLYGGRLAGQSDLCCYWFEKARQQIQDGRCKRAGLLATQGIRGGANRKVLERIKETGDIFFAVSDRDWILDGANVHVSMVGFDGGTEQERVLDGHPTPEIHINLSGAVNVTQAARLSANTGICYLGVMKAGDFDITDAAAQSMLAAPNPHHRPNSDVLRPRLTARDILQRGGKGWIIDFGCETTEDEGAYYEAPWQYISANVKPVREQNRRSRMAVKWWLHGEARPGMRRSLTGLNRFIVTPEVSKHRIFIWLDAVYLADHQTRAIARSDDYSFGVLQSRVHELWARSQGTQLRESESGFRYTPSTCFETFPFPEPTEQQRTAIGVAAAALNELREGWLNPPDWMREEILSFPGAFDGPWSRYVIGPGPQGVGTVHFPRLIARDPDCGQKLATRTLTNLYNQMPAWLVNAHKRLDSAVCSAYGWPSDIEDSEIVVRLLALNLEGSK